MRYNYSCLGKVYSVWIEKHKYANGRTVVTLWDDDGQVTCATVNLSEATLGQDEVLIKTWGESEELLPFLIKNHIVQDLGRDVATNDPIAKARVCKLLI